MRLKNIDWSSDAVLFTIILIVLLIVVAMLLERASPKKSRGKEKKLSPAGSNARRESGGLIY